MTLTMKLGLSTLCLVVLLAVTEGQWKKKIGDGGYVPLDPKDPRWRKMLEEIIKTEDSNRPKTPYKPIWEVEFVARLEIPDATYDEGVYKMTYTTQAPRRRWALTECKIEFLQMRKGDENIYAVDKWDCNYVLKGKKSTHH